MDIKIVDNEIPIPYVADNLVARKCHKLERMLHTFKPEAVSLTVDLSRASGKSGYQLKMNLQMHNAALNVHTVGKSVVDVFGSGFNKLFASVAELKATMRATEETKRQRENAEQALAGVQIPQTVRAILAEFFSRNYGRFYNYALREIRFRSYQGYAKPGAIDVADVLNEAFMVVAAQHGHDVTTSSTARLVYQEIGKAIERLLTPGGIALVPVEATIEPEDIDTAYQEYYQPDEIIKVEDVLVDADSILPEQEVEYREVETYIDQLLSQLPASWREAFILFAREGLSVAEIASNKGTVAAQVKTAIENARQFIRHKLRDGGFEWKE
ncbi:MAG: hypothetical protein JW768_06000 [Chitinispirillaceae bacterium]|nr:hypothetical protein [Chitinispirillaceae bacterium]